MKIGQYKQMNAYLTRPGTPEQKKKAEENNAKYLAERKANALKKFGLENHVVDTLNKFEDGPNIKPPKNIGEYFQNKEKEKSDGGPDILRNILIEEMKTRDLDSNEIKYLMDTKDRSQIKKQKISNTEQQILTKETTPKQVAKLAKSPEAGVKKPKKVVAPLKLPTVDMEQLNLVNQVPDPEILKLEKRFNEIIKQKEEQDFKNKTTGLAGILGGTKYE